MAGHTNAVTSVVWGEGNHVFSGSWDHTIRQWDITSGINIHTMTGQKAIASLAYSSLSGLIASAGTDKLVRVWDPRERGITNIR